MIIKIQTTALCTFKLFRMIFVTYFFILFFPSEYIFFMIFFRVALGSYLLALALFVLYVKLVKNHAKILIRLIALGAFYLAPLSLTSTIFYYCGGILMDVGSFIIIIFFIFILVTVAAVKHRKKINYSIEITVEAAK